MFYYLPNHHQKDRLEQLFRKAKAIYGTVPPQVIFLGNIECDYLEQFLENAKRIMRHPTIARELFAFIRLHIAFLEDYRFCKQFNTQLLLSGGYTQTQLDAVIQDITAVPFEEREKALATFAIKTIYHSKEVQKEDFEKLYDLDWSQKDIFDLVSHTGDIFKNGRILNAYEQRS